MPPSEEADMQKFLLFRKYISKMKKGSTLLKQESNGLHLRWFVLDESHKFFHWVNPKRDQLIITPENTIYISDITSIQLGPAAQVLFEMDDTKALSNVDALSLSFSVATRDQSIEIYPVSKLDFEIWYFGLVFLAGVDKVKTTPLPPGTILRSHTDLEFLQNRLEEQLELTDSLLKENSRLMHIRQERDRIVSLLLEQARQCTCGTAQRLLPRREASIPPSPARSAASQQQLPYRDVTPPASPAPVSAQGTPMSSRSLTSSMMSLARRRRLAMESASPISVSSRPSRSRTPTSSVARRLSMERGRPLIAARRPRTAYAPAPVPAPAPAPMRYSAGPAYDELPTGYRTRSTSSGRSAGRRRVRYDDTAVQEYLDYYDDPQEENYGAGDEDVADLAAPSIASCTTRSSLAERRRYVAPEDYEEEPPYPERDEALLRRSAPAARRGSLSGLQRRFYPSRPPSRLGLLHPPPAEPYDTEEEEELWASRAPRDYVPDRFVEEEAPVPMPAPRKAAYAPRRCHDAGWRRYRY
ncbi:hypothetical protein PAPYR_4931 [Paratrimastix pyriformis]|uniref:PH domain-containing protein n=1 Tax=Paratrimastix pyriformis TaxID=342808 RepID=A0ABQ8UIS6_9EUKA|nr:hypothetical protein PAPYR_4931 [Paratrimastix pyriformis]